MTAPTIPADRLAAFDAVYGAWQRISKRDAKRIDRAYEQITDKEIDAIEDAGTRAIEQARSSGRWTSGVEVCSDDMCSSLVPFASDIALAELVKDLISAADHQTLAAWWIKHVGPVPA